MKTKIEQGNAPAWSPGPWDVHGDITQQLYYVHGANTICDMHKPSGFYRSPRETEANARLIAAAPEMAEALREVTRCLSEYRQTGYMHGWDKPLAETRALLARIGAP